MLSNHGNQVNSGGFVFTGFAPPTANGLPGVRPAGPRVPGFGVRPPGPPSMGAPPQQAPPGGLPQSPAAPQAQAGAFPPQQQMLGRPGLIPPGKSGMPVTMC